MNLIPYRRRKSGRLSPISFIEELQEDLNSFFGDNLVSVGDTTSNIGHWLPSTDIHDLGDKIMVKTDLPGIDRKDLEVFVEGNTLFIRGEKKHEDSVKDVGYLKSERFFGRFERALPLSEDVDSSKIDGAYKDGVLTLTIPRKENSREKNIKINIK